MRGVSSSPDCTHKHMLENGATPLTNLCPVPSVTYKFP